MKLGQVAQIMIGIVVKREAVEGGEKSYKLFSPRSYEEKLAYETITTSKDFSDKTLKEGDLIFRLVYPNKIVYANKELEGMLIPSQFCIIRTEKEKIDSTVLKWYFESKRAETELKSKITGSIIKSMSIANLRELEIPEIPIAKQKKMKQLITLWEEEKSVTEKILKEKEELYNAYLEEIVERGERLYKKK